MNCLRKLVFVFFNLGSLGVNAQITDTIAGIDLETVIVTSFREHRSSETSVNLVSVRADSVGNAAYNLSDLLAKTPGVRMLGTGPAIAKPVIRGLYGNRVLVLLSGLRFDNQQWQEEHGLGLSEVGLSRIELIKGPLSVLYGSEAMGGVINLIEEEKPAPGNSERDFSLRFNSNTLGGTAQAGFKKNSGNKWWGIRVAAEDNGDYSDGKNQRVLNSRFDGYTLKSTYGFLRKKWLSVNHYMSSFNRFGFIFNDVYTFIEPDTRWSRNLSENPAHLVALNILSSENKIVFNERSVLTVNAGLQSNERMENEGGGAISLNMHLFTAQYMLKWENKLNEKNRLIISNMSNFENNTNLGARKIVPDANMYEINLSAYLETRIKKHLLMENGVGSGTKSIKAFLTPSVNGPGKEVGPFHKVSPYYNFFSGFTFFPTDRFNMKLNASSGVRVPNLAELSSNGLHEGVFTYEIGDPQMKNEQNISFNFFLNYTRNKFEFSISPFYNLFYNYVYLAPTKEDWFGFPVFRYKQQDVSQYGTEMTITVKPSRSLTSTLSYSGMRSIMADGQYTPYTPPQRITPSVNYVFMEGKMKGLYLAANADYFTAQNEVAEAELTTPEYWLLNLSAGTSLSKKNQVYSFSVAVNNLLNTAYYDHLSRFKYFGILNMGRNIVVSLKIRFIKTGENK